MNLIWIIGGIGMFGILAKQFGWRGVRTGPRDLGFVSQQWLMEHRLSDPQR